MAGFYAHSGQNIDKSDWQLLQDHLEQVAKRAGAFAAVFGARPWGRLAGHLHDAGKATRAFQLRLEGKQAKVDHATFGARKAQQTAGPLGILLAYVIAGHHGGLPNGGAQDGQLHFRLKHGKVPSDAALNGGANSNIQLSPPFNVLPKDLAGFRLAFFTRMVYSCLVDADFLDTESFCAPERSKARYTIPLSAQTGNQTLDILKAKLDAHLYHLVSKAPKTPVNLLREKILTQCRESAGSQGRIFSLSVPTGGGKTLSSMAFALDHAVAGGLDRVIYTIPFTSIIEQNAKVFQDILGRDAVLEHHCNYKEKDDHEEAPYERRRGLAAENWDAPVVVTTNVQFFESLFSHKPSRCRKLHNIARSIIVLDEAQAIPTPYIEPCLAALNELVEIYGCTLVLCTATQPAFDDRHSLGAALSGIHEIIPEPEGLYNQLRRTQINFTGRLSQDQLAERLGKEDQVLCITATKPQARELFESLNQAKGTYHLSTNMYPAHRRQVLDKVREQMRMGQPCRVVSTSLVEAGVDLDFPVVYRAMAGLDSIAQAAGRCNREGRLTKDGLTVLGQVHVYDPETAPSMPWLNRCISRAREVLRNMGEGDPIGLEAMHRYFELLYDIQETDKKGILDRFPALNQLTPELILPFREVGEAFRLIEEETVGIVVPMEKEAEDLVKTLGYAEFPGTVLRRLQQFTVAVRQKEFEMMQKAGALEMIKDRIPVLRNLKAYDRDLGLCVDRAQVWEVESLIQ